MAKTNAVSQARYVLVNRLAAPLGAFIILVIIGRQSDELLGQYALVMTFYYVMQMLPLLGLTSYVMREVARAPKDAGEYYTTIGFMSLVGCVAIDLICWIFLQFVDYPKPVLNAIYLAGILILPGILAFIGEIIFIALHKAKPVAYVATIENTARVIFSVAVLWAGGGLVALMLVFLAARSTAFIAYTAIMKKQDVLDRFTMPSRRILRKTLSVLPSFLIGAVLFIILSRMDFLILSIYQQIEIIGYYAVAYRLFEICIIVLTALIMAIFPWVAKQFVGAHLHYQVAVKNIVLLFSISLLVVSISGVLIAEEYVAILFAKQYPHPVLLTQLFMAVLLLAGMDFVASGILHASDEQRMDVKATAIGGGAAVMLLVLLVPHFGMYGAFSAKTFATLLQCGIKYRFLNQMLGPLWTFGQLWRLFLFGGLLVGLLMPLLAFPLFAKLFALAIVIVILVPLVLTRLGLIQPLRLLRFYWRNQNASDAKSIIDTVDLIVADSRRYDFERSLCNAAHDRALTGFDSGPIAMVLYRTARFLFLNGKTRSAHLIQKLSKLFCNVHIAPESRLGAGFVILFPQHIHISASAGKNLTCFGSVRVGTTVPADLGDNIRLTSGTTLSGLENRCLEC